MNEKRVLRRCRSLLKGLEVPSPLDVDALLRRVSDRTGRLISLVPQRTPLGLCGVWVALPDRDVICFEASESKVFREHIILHEVGHILCQHSHGDRPDVQLMGQLLPHLDPRVVRRVMGRSRYTEPEELEAEVMASVIIERAGGGFEQLPNRAPAEGNPGLGRLAHALGGRPSG